MSKRSSLERIDADFSREMKEISRIRVSKGLAKPRMDEISVREMTSLTRRTSAWPNVLEELRTKPKRKDR